MMLLSDTAAIASAIVWGFVVLAALSYFLARSQGSSVMLVTLEHLAIATVVVVAAHWIGDWTREVLN